MGNLLTATQLAEKTSLSNRAMKFKLHRGGTRAKVRDANAEAQLQADTGDDSYIVSKDLFKSKTNLVRLYQQESNAMYQAHIKFTLPYGDDGTRVLPNKAYFDYTTDMQARISKLDQIKDRILQNWDTLVQDDVNERNAALIKLGKAPTASITEYPTKDQMERRLYVTWYPEPIAESSDFRFAVPPDMLATLDAQQAAYEQDIKRDYMQRIAEPLEAFIKKLSTPIGQEGAIFRNSLVENVDGMVNHMSRLNIDDDPVVDAVLDEIRQFIKPYVFNPDVLRESPVVRENAKNKMAEMMKKLEGYRL